jgi:hypothetical protein
MNRRFAVLGLAVALSGAVVAGQTPYRLNEIPPDALEMPSSAMGALLRMRQSVSHAANPSQPWAPLVVTVEAVGPKLTRVRLTQQDLPLATFEAAAFTVTTGTDGTTIAASDRVKMHTSSGRTLWTDDGFELRTDTAGRILETSGQAGR